MNLGEIQEFWVKAGEAFPKDAAITPTSRDPYLGGLERTNILRYLRPGMKVLEAGCGDGSHAMHYAEVCGDYVGVDISPGLLDVARQRAKAAGLSRAEFRCASLLELPKHFPAESFDVVITQRAIINLPTWEHQQQAMEGLRSLLKPGGVYLMTEGFQEPLEALNEARQKHALPTINVVPYNRNLKLAEYEPWRDARFQTVASHDYGFYLYLSRVLHPMAVTPEQPKHDGPINRAARDLADEPAAAAFRRFSYNLFFVLKK